MKTPVTSRSLKEHITYNWWKYLLIIAFSIGLVDILYTATAYKPPREKTVSFYVVGYVNEDSLNAYMENVRETEMPDMESVSATVLLQDDTYTAMQVLTYMAAGEGDLYMLRRDDFLSYAENGSLIPLEEDAELISIFDQAGVSLQSGWRRNAETGETHLYGIPQDKLPGLSQYIYPQNGYISVVITGANTENAMKFLRILCRDMVTEPAQE